MELIVVVKNENRRNVFQGLFVRNEENIYSYKMIEIFMVMYFIIGRRIIRLIHF